MIARYHALLKIAELACAQAAQTGAAAQPEFWQTLAVALEDDCPAQSGDAALVAGHLATAERSRADFFNPLER